jgi:hypothetical protein
MGHGLAGGIIIRGSAMADMSKRVPPARLHSISSGRSYVIDAACRK